MAVQPITSRSAQRSEAGSNDLQHARGIRQAKRWDAPDENQDPKERSKAYAFTRLGKEEEGFEQTEQGGDNGEQIDDRQQVGTQQPQEEGLFSPWQRQQEKKRLWQQQETQEKSTNFDGQKAQLDPGVLDTEGAARMRGETQAMKEAEAIGGPIREAKMQQLAQEQERLRQVAQNSYRSTTSSLREQVQQEQIAQQAAGKQIAAAAKGAAATQSGTAKIAGAASRGLFSIAIKNPWVMGGIAGVVLLSGLFIFVAVGGVAYVCYVDKGFVGTAMSWYAQLTGMVQCSTDEAAAPTGAQQAQQDAGDPSASAFMGAEL